MSESATPDTGAVTPAAATEQRSALMQSADFRSAAMNPASAQWQQLTKLNETIAAGMQAEEDADEQEATPAKQSAEQTGEPQGDEDAPFVFEAPARPEDYKLPQQEARALGLPVNFEAEIELKAGFHKAQVDAHLAQLLYVAATTAAARPPTQVQLATEHHASETALRRAWGPAAFEKNLALANAEARRVFDAMPSAITGGASFKDWCTASGLANNRVLIEEFLHRAKARARTTR